MVSSSLIVLTPLPFESDQVFSRLPQKDLDEYINLVTSKIGKSRYIIIPAAGQVADALRNNGIEYAVNTPTRVNEAYGNNPLCIWKDLS